MKLPELLSEAMKRNEVHRIQRQNDRQSEQKNCWDYKAHLHMQA